MADITYIPIRQLYPHPDNPRKELGDLSELAASIKENGVYQNLTVIPGHYLNSREYIAKCVDEGGDAAAAAAAWTPKAVWSSEDYTIIIGHRRAEAAQQAGLYELPCAIVEMDEREQMQTMMIENAAIQSFTNQIQIVKTDSFCKIVVQLIDGLGANPCCTCKFALCHPSFAEAGRQQNSNHSLLSPFTEILADMYPACLHFGRKLHISGVFSDFR